MCTDRIPFVPALVRLFTYNLLHSFTMGYDYSPGGIMVGALIFIPFVLRVLFRIGCILNLSVALFLLLAIVVSMNILKQCNVLFFFRFFFSV